MHTDHSSDCATPVEVLLATAADAGPRRDRGHRPQRDLRCARRAREGGEYGIKVIVGEEVKTADQGEVIGLFIEEKIPRGMTLAETIAEIRRQGGLVYVPHPSTACTRCRTTSTCSRSSRTSTRSRSSTRASRSPPSTRRPSLRGKYRHRGRRRLGLARAAALGSVRIRMRDFDGPEEFLESLRTPRSSAGRQPSSTAGAEIPPDEGHAAGCSPRSPGHRRVRQACATNDAVARTSTDDGEIARRDARDRRRDSSRSTWSERFAS